MNKSAIHFLALGGLLVAGSCWGNGGHFNVDDASIAPGGTCGLETWASRLEATEIAVLRPSCNFTGNAEWALPAVYNLDTDEFTHLGLEYKTVWLDVASGPALGFIGGVNYHLANDEFNDVYIKVPISFQLLDNLTLHANLGALHDRPARDTYATWGLAATVKTVSGPDLIVEATDTDQGDPVVAAGVRFGLGTTRWTLDLGAARDTGPGENIYTLGLNIPRFF